MLRKVIRLSAIGIILTAALGLISPLPVASQSMDEYFQFSYDPIRLSKDEINGSEVFHATVSGRATCNQDLPFSVSEVSITYSVIAEQAGSSNMVTLNSSYTITIKPFPSKQGDTAEINEAIPLQFPPQAESGNYNVIGKLVEAKATALFGFNVTDYLPQEQLIGSLEYIASEPTSTPASTSAQTPPGPPPAPESSEGGISWWIWLIIAVAVVIAVVIIIYFRRQIS